MAVRWFMGLIVALPLAACAALPAPGTPGAPKDSRYCGEPPRDANGDIKRSMYQRQLFINVWPKPDRPGVWYVDHVLPMAVGGCDLPHNMQWLNAETKTCAKVCKDRFEREIYDPRRPGERH